MCLCWGGRLGYSQGAWSGRKSLKPEDINRYNKLWGLDPRRLSEIILISTPTRSCISIHLKVTRIYNVRSWNTMFSSFLSDLDFDTILIIVQIIVCVIKIVLFSHYFYFYLFLK